jgi:hypothetical protein
VKDTAPHDALSWYNGEVNWYFLQVFAMISQSAHRSNAKAKVRENRE